MSKTVAVPEKLERFLELLFQCGDELRKVSDDLSSLSLACSLIDSAIEGWFDTISSELVRMKRMDLEIYLDQLRFLSVDDRHILFTKVCQCDQCKSEPAQCSAHDRFNDTAWFFSEQNRINT